MVFRLRLSITIRPIRSMGDMDGPAIAKRVYDELFKESSEALSSDAVAYGLDAAIQDLRAKGVYPSRWGTYVHFGM